jgi:molybdopterin-containing oxidoreductase family iron-sulfur binding subunit
MEYNDTPSSDPSSSRRRFLNGILSKEGNPFFPDTDESVKETGEKVQLLSVDGYVVEVDKAYLKPVPDVHISLSTDGREGIEGRKFVMVIDLSRCKNLKKCQSACNKMHFVNEGQNWIKVHAMQDSEHSAPYWQPTTCMHCDEPPCVKVCPVDATFKRSDGIVLIDNQRCIGCRFCMAACPYSTRVFNWEKPLLPKVAEDATYSPETSCPPQIGTVGKCDFCPDMIRKGELPHCVSACPNGVFFFGDINEDAVTNGAETFRFHELIRDRAGFRLMEDLGTKPRVYYLPPVNRLFRFEEGLEEG